MGNLTSKLATEVSDKQTFRTPSVYVDGSRFKIEECLLINLEDDEKGEIKVSKDNPNSEAKAFPVFRTSLGGNNQYLFVSTLFKARPGLDKDGKLVSFLPSGKFTDEVKATIVGLGHNPTLTRVKDALNASFRNKEVLCKWQELTAISRDGRQYADHVYVLDYAPQALTLSATVGNWGLCPHFLTKTLAKVYNRLYHRSGTETVV